MARADKSMPVGDVLQDTVQVLLAAPLSEEGEEGTAALLSQLGLPSDQQSAILLQLIRKAKEGDFRSIQMVRELSDSGEETGGRTFADDLRMVSTEELERMLGAGPDGAMKNEE